ncbi:MAG: hypothetical protein ACRC7V_06340 [Lachnospiraceae bacterium]
MSFIHSTVDKTTVNYETWFHYTFQISFSGLISPINPAFVLVDIPNTLEFDEPICNFAKNITSTTIDTMTQLKIDFSPVMDTGVSITFNLRCRFKQTTPSLEEVSLHSYLYTGSAFEYSMESICETVTLFISPLYSVLFNPIIPANNTAASNGSVIYEVILQNFGDAWPTSSSFSFNVNLDTSTYFTLDETFLIAGLDASPNTLYKDTSCDGIFLTPYESGNGFTFTLPSYRGQIYHFYFRVFIVSELSIGTTIVQPLTWSINSIFQTSVSSFVRIVTPTYLGTVTAFGPMQVNTNNYMFYNSTIKNIGNQDLTNVVIEYEVPLNQITPYQLTTGRYTLGSLDIVLNQEYTITYVTTQGEEYPFGDSTNPQGIYNTNASSTLLLGNLIPVTRSVHYIRFYIGNLPIGMMSSSPPTLKALSKATIEIGSTILFHSTLKWLNGSGILQTYPDNHSTSVSLLSSLAFSSHTITPSFNIIPGDILTVRSVINCLHSQLNEPIYVNILPKELQFLKTTPLLIDSIYFEFYNGQTGTTINSVSNKSIFPFPIPELIPQQDGSTIFRLKPPNSVFFYPQMSEYKIQYNLQVAIGALGTITNSAILGNTGNHGIIYDNQDIIAETQEIDIDGDGVIAEALVVSPEVTLSFIEYPGIYARKECKGSADTTFIPYPDVATSEAGSTIHYRITIQNIGNINIDTLELIDIMPYVNDTSILEPEIYRNSQFKLYQVTSLLIKLFDIHGVEIPTLPTTTISFSKSEDPVRFGPDGSLIGSDNDWSSILPTPITDLSSYKVTFRNLSILPGYYFEITAACIIPSDIPIDYIAWNSIALQATYRLADNIPKTLLPTEARKAGIKIIDLANTGLISGHIFLDQNKDGIYVFDDPGINDVGIILYQVEGTSATAIASTLTVKDSSGEDGHFSFHVPYNQSYMMRIVPNTYKYTLSPQVLHNPFGSFCNPKTGFTPIFEMTPDTPIFSIKSGVLYFDRTNYILKVNNEAHKTMRSVLYNEMLLENKLVEITEFMDKQE